jgi:hypothetical protein
MKLIDNIKLSLTRADHTAEDYKDDWKQTANKYKATIKYNKKSLTIPYYTGCGWQRDPDLEDILGTLLMDAAYYDYSFEDFAREMGYDPDSRKTKKIYNDIQKQTEKLNSIFSEEEQRELLIYLEKAGKL